MVVLLLALLGSAHSQEPPPAPPPPEAIEPAPPDAQPAEPTAAQPGQVPTDILLDQAGERIEERDFLGARILLDQAMARDDVDADRALYLRGMSWEFGGEPAQAIPLYDEGLRLYPAGPHTQDRHFRMAEALDTLGSSREALEWLDRIDAEALTGLPRYKYDLVHAITLVHAGKRKKGLKAIADALAAVTADELTFYQAKARATVAADSAAQAERKWNLQGGVLTQRSHLIKRARMISEVQDQATAIAQLDEPEWVLDAVLTLGNAYASLAKDLEGHPRPDNFDEHQLALYDREVEKRVETLRIKGLKSCDLALDMAIRLGWQSRRVGELEALRDELSQAIEG